MAGENGAATLQLSDEAKALIDAAEKRAKTAETKADKLNEQVSGLMSDRIKVHAEQGVSKLRKLGFTEEAGCSGMLARTRLLLLADDGGAAIVGDNFATDENPGGTLSFSDALLSVFDAFDVAEDGKAKVLVGVKQPIEKVDEAKLGDDGKPKKDDEGDGVPKLTDADLSQDVFEMILAHSDPDEAKMLGLSDDKIKELAGKFVEKYGDKLEASESGGNSGKES